MRNIKTIGILLAVLFVVSMTAAAASAGCGGCNKCNKCGDGIGLGNWFPGKWLGDGGCNKCGWDGCNKCGCDDKKGCFITAVRAGCATGGDGNWFNDWGW